MFSLYIIGVMAYLFVSLIYTSKNWNKWPYAMSYGHEELSNTHLFALWFCSLGAILWPLSVLVLTAVFIGRKLSS